MKGIVVSGAFAALGMFFVWKGWSMQRNDRALVARFATTKGRVTDQGTSERRSTFRQSDGTDREDISYEGHYEYSVHGRHYTGITESSAPVFQREDMPPNEITVYYDPKDPSVSRTTNNPDNTGKLYINFGLVIIGVALVMATIANLGDLIAILKRGAG